MDAGHDLLLKADKHELHYTTPVFPHSNSKVVVVDTFCLLVSLSVSIKRKAAKMF